MDFSEKWGTDVDEAVRLALLDLRLTIEEVNVIVLEEPSKGFFGIGSKLAKVRVEKKVEKKPEKVFEKTPEPQKPAVAEKKVAEAEVKNENKPAFTAEKPKNSSHREKSGRSTRSENTDRAAENHSPVQERPDDLKDAPNHAAIVFLKEITEKMGLALNISAMENESSVYVDIEGKDSGTVIGKRGQTLDAIQYLTSLVVNKDKEKYVRVVVDAESYRAKREKTLEQLACRLADKVVKSKKSVRLEPMNPYERKVIHATLQKNPDVTT
ncbi:MAG: RNA-binding cell elongation regulator Jag/EloR, partial [Anaerovorax sp.]